MHWIIQKSTDSYAVLMDYKIDEVMIYVMREKKAKQYGRKKGWKACVVSVSDKTITVSTALGGYIGKRIDIYEFENVLAIVNDPNGLYNSSQVAPNSDRVQIHSRPLARYIQEKYSVRGCAKFPAWADRNENILFCNGNAGDNQQFHSGFVKVSEPERYRYENSIRLIGNRFYIASMFSDRLIGRLSLFEDEKIFALLCDPYGDLVTSDRNEFGTKTICAPRLVEYARLKFGTDTLYGVGLHSGIAFSGDRLITNKKITVARMNKLTENQNLQKESIAR